MVKKRALKSPASRKSAYDQTYNPVLGRATDMTTVTINPVSVPRQVANSGLSSSGVIEGRGGMSTVKLGGLPLRHARKKFK